MTKGGKIKYLLFLVCIILLLSACKTTGVKKRYVGKTVSYNNPWWCAFNDLQKTCTLGTEDGWFMFDFTIRKGQIEGEYIIEGYADGTKGRAKSFRTLTMRDTKFNILLAYQKELF